LGFLSEKLPKWVCRKNIFPTNWKFFFHTFGSKVLQLVNYWAGFLRKILANNNTFFLLCIWQTWTQEFSILTSWSCCVIKNFGVRKKSWERYYSSEEWISLVQSKELFNIHKTPPQKNTGSNAVNSLNYWSKKSYRELKLW